MTLDRDSFFIGGEWATPASDQLLQVVSPHSEEVVARVPEGTDADLDAAGAAARIAVVEAFSGLYAANLEQMAGLITTEMGSPTSFSNLAQSPAPWMQIE